MGSRFLHSNLTAGELNPFLHSRVDIEKFSSGVAVAKNVTISPFGGLRRRGGLEKLEGGYLGAGYHRISSFIASDNFKFVIIFSVGEIKIMHLGVVVSTVSAPLLSSEAIIRELDAVQYLDTMIIVQEDIKPFKLVRDPLDVSNWTVGDITFNIPQYSFTNEPRPQAKFTNTGYPVEVTTKIGDIIYNVDGNDDKGLNETYYKAKVDKTTLYRLDEEDFLNATDWEVIAWGEDAWSDSRGWPSVATFHGQRLWLAATKSLPQSVFGSKINGYFDFRTGLAEADSGVFDTLETGDYNKIVNLTTGRSLQVFTRTREFINTELNITPENSSWSSQTEYGAKRIRPIGIDGSTYFVDSVGGSIRSLIYNRDEDGYISPSISLLASHIINDVVDIDAVKGTSLDVSDFLYVVNGDGTVAVLNTNRLENISGWTHWNTQGLFKDVSVVGKEVYFLVERGGENYIERLTDSTYSDHNVIKKSTSTSIDTVNTDFSGAVKNMTFKVTADLSIQPEVTITGADGSNSVTIGRLAERIEVGLGYESEITTLPEAPATKGGNMVHRKKRIGRVNVDFFETLGTRIKEINQSERRFIVSLDKVEKPITGVKEVRLMGYSKTAQVSVFQDQPLPMFVRSIEVEIIY